MAGSDVDRIVDVTTSTAGELLGALREAYRDGFSADILLDLERHGNGEAPETVEGRKAVALKRWKI